MQIFLIVLLVIFAIIGLGITVAVIKIRRLVKEKGAPLVARARVFGLETALEVIKERAAKPENAGNADIAALQQRVEATLAEARTAYEASDYAKVAQISDPLLAELGEIAQRLAEEERIKREAEAARQAANADGKVIDGEFTEVKERAALLPVSDAPTNATTNAADTTGAAPTDATGATPPPASATGTEGDGTKK